MDSCGNPHQMGQEIGAVGLSFEKNPTLLSGTAVTEHADFFVNALSLSNQSEESADPASPVEEARLQAERAALNYASARKTGGPRSPAKSAKVSGPSFSRTTKKERQGAGNNDFSMFSGGEEEGGKKDSYQRRLALNRESAAVSRNRRREYIRQLEERLARVETNKNQLLGQVEIMVQQNKQMSQQLSACFQLMAANQRPSQDTRSDFFPLDQKEDGRYGLP